MNDVLDKLDVCDLQKEKNQIVNNSMFEENLILAEIWKIFVFMTKKKS